MIITITGFIFSGAVQVYRGLGDAGAGHQGVSGRNVVRVPTSVQ